MESILIIFFIVKCCVQIHTLRSLSSKDKVAKVLLVNLITRSVCSQVQWKQRGRDRRIGIGHLVNFIAIFGGIVFSTFSFI